MNNIKLIEHDLISHDHVMSRLQEIARQSKGNETFAKKIDTWFTIDSKIYFSEDKKYGSGIVVDRLIEVDDGKKKAKYLLKPKNKNPFDNEVFGSWKVDRDGLTYMVTVFVGYE